MFDLHTTSPQKVPCWLPRSSDHRATKQEHMQDGALFDYFTWQPPPAKMKLSKFAKKLQGKEGTAPTGRRGRFLERGVVGLLNVAR